MTTVLKSLTWHQRLWLWKNSFVTIKPFSTKALKPRKEKGHATKPKGFLDFLRVRVIGGTGGDGKLAFTSQYRKEFAGPDGGNGGCGGHVIFASTVEERSLNEVKSVIKAANGIRGGNNNMHGKNAEHLYVQLPLGTMVKDEEGHLLTDLEEENDYYIAAKGGAGGFGNRHFVSSTDTTPRFAERGSAGEERILNLELKIMAHAGLVGFPNAGKSTLLRAISRARPKVAPYPFTTLKPHIGMVEYEDFEQIAVADIPGLIPDAHKNKGLGIAFLRHIERCSCLLYVLDLSTEEPWIQLEQLKYELEQYKRGLSEVPYAIIGNKMDLEIARKNLIELKEKTDLKVIPISAKDELNVMELQAYLRELYDENCYIHKV